MQFCIIYVHVLMHTFTYKNPLYEVYASHLKSFNPDAGIRQARTLFSFIHPLKRISLALTKTFTILQVIIWSIIVKNHPAWFLHNLIIITVDILAHVRKCLTNSVLSAVKFFSLDCAHLKGKKSKPDCLPMTAHVYNFGSMKLKKKKNRNFCYPNFCLMKTFLQFWFYGN